MKRWKVAVVICAIATCASLLLAGCNSQEYKPPAKDQTVPAAALGQNGTLRVGVDASHAPLAGKPADNPSADIIGIDVDVARYLADQMGLKVEIIDVGNDPAAALDGGKVDVVLGVDSSEDDGTYWKSEPYLVTGVALFGTSTESSVPTLDSKPKIAAQGSTTSSWRVTNLFGDGSLVTQNNLKAAFEAMNSGAARYVASDAVVGTYVAHVNGYNEKIVALLEDPNGFCAAVASNNTDLQGAVASAINKLTSGGIIDIIESQWLGEPLKLDSITVVKSQAANTTPATTTSSASSASASSASASSAYASSASAESAQ